jgi:hypothetical protein
MTRGLKNADRALMNIRNELRWIEDKFEKNIGMLFAGY